MPTDIQTVRTGSSTEYIDFALAIGAPPEGGQLELRGITFGGRQLQPGRDADSVTFYPGSEDQEPDPLHASATGDLTPAYRGIGYIVVRRMKVEDFRKGIRISVEGEDPSEEDEGVDAIRCGRVASEIGVFGAPLSEVYTYLEVDSLGRQSWANIGPTIGGNAAIVDGTGRPGSVPMGYTSGPLQYIDGADLALIGAMLNSCVGTEVNPCVADFNNEIVIIDSVDTPSGANPLSPVRAYFRVLAPGAGMQKVNAIDGVLRRLFEGFGTLDDSNFDVSIREGITPAEIQERLGRCAEAPPPPLFNPPPVNPDGSPARYFAFGEILTGFTSGLTPGDKSALPHEQVQERNAREAQRRRNVLWYYTEEDVATLSDGYLPFFSPPHYVHSGLLTLRWVQWGGTGNPFSSGSNYRVVDTASGGTVQIAKIIE